MIRNKSKCNRGFPCGRTCISRKRQCWANLSTSNSKMAETFSQFVNRIVGIGNETQSEIVIPLESSPTIVTEDEDEDTMVIVDLPPGIVEPGEYSIKKLSEFFDKSNYWKEKLEKVKTEFPDLDENEAMGIALWISNEYSGMNNKLWKDISDEEREKLEKDPAEAMYFAANYFAYNAIISGNKIPKYDRQQMEIDIAEKNKTLPDYQQLAINPRNVLNRGLNRVDKYRVEEIKKYYSDNLGKTVQEKTFFATTSLNPENIGFTRSADILFEVIPKENSKGVMVDKGKNELYEGEVLFAPGTNFNVVGVEDIVVSNNPNVSIDYLNNLSNGKLPQEIKQKLESLSLPNHEIIQIMNRFVLRMEYDMPLDNFTEDMLFMFEKLTPALVKEIYNLKEYITPEDIKSMDYINFNGGINISQSLKIILEEI